MTKNAVMWFIIASFIVGMNAATWAQETDVGKIEYQSTCATCHGIDGKGNGPVSKELKIHPTDLTIISKKNNGVLPVDRLYRMIDGRISISSHGTREMPIWGYAFKGPYREFSPVFTEAVVRGRILAVIDYLNRIQEK